MGMIDNPMADYRVNPMAGALAGMNIADMQQTANRQYRDSDLANLMKQHEFEMSQQEDPAKLAEFMQRQKQAQMNTDVIDSGKPKAAAMSKLDTEMDTNQTTQSGNKIQRLIDSGQALNQVSNELKAKPMGSPMDEGETQRWARIQKDLGEHGINVPATWDTNTVDHIHAQAQSFVDNLPTMREAMKIRETGSQQRQNTALEGQNALNLAGVNNASKERINATEPGRALEEAMKAVSSGTANPGQKQLLAIHLAEKLMAPSLNSSGGQMVGLGGSQATQDFVKDIINSVMNNKPGGNDTKSAPADKAADQAKIDKVLKANPSVPRDAIIKDMKAKKLISSDYAD